MAGLVAKLTFGVGMLFVAFLLPLTRDIVTIWIGPHDYPGDLSTYLIVAAFLLETASTTQAQFLLAMNSNRVLSMLMVCKAATVFLFSILFVAVGQPPLVSIAGASVFASAIGLCGSHWLINKRLDVEFVEHTWQVLVKPGLLAIAVLGGSFLLSQEGSMLVHAIGGLVSALAFSGLYVLFVFTADERFAVIDAARKRVVSA